jgi:hypothetical protein
MNGETPGLHPGNRQSKEQVNYRQHEKCLNCDHFFNSGSCDMVSGNISPANVCDLFEIKSAEPQGKDREFYQAEFNKANK